MRAGGWRKSRLPVVPEVALVPSPSRPWDGTALGLRAARFMWRLPGARAWLRGAVRAAGRRGGTVAAEGTEAAAMERAVVRCVPSEATLVLSLTLADGRRRHLQRDQSEPLGRALGRLAANALKGRRGQGKKKKPPPRADAEDGAEPAPVPVRLWLRGQPVADDVRNADAWQDGAVLQVGDARYRVERNPPALTDLRLPRPVMAGFPAWPRLGLEFARPDACRFRWFREARPAEDGREHDHDREHQGEDQQDHDQDEDRQDHEHQDHDRTRWTDTGERGRTYTPRASDVGLRLKLRCTPGDGQRLGASRELRSEPVEAGPGACAFERRHLHTRRPAGPAGLRAVSYNVLADAYARTDFARAALFPYCAPYALEPDYRLSLLLHELAGYRADLLCLQEVDRAAFADVLAPALGALGLDGLFHPKRPQEGLATFFRSDRLRLLGRHDVALGDALRDDPRHRELLARLARTPAARERVLQRSSVLQVSVLESTRDPARKICVANTHLYWHPRGGYIRLVQMAVALAHIQHVSCELYPGIPVIFCGDFNSTPSAGAYRFAVSGSIAEDHEDWASYGEEERCSMSLTHSFKLKSACGEPAYTNYVGGFHGCLDYIFIDWDAFEVEQVIPLPSHEEVTAHQALPSVSHPSDHIALVCDLKWK